MNFNGSFNLKDILMGNLTFRTFIIFVSALILQACGQGNEQGFLEAVAVNKQGIISLTVVSNDESQRVRVGETQGFTATANIEGGTTSDVTSKVRWTSSDPSIVTIDGVGVAKGVQDGTVDIAVTYADLSASTTLKSSSADIESIAVTNPNTSLSLCDTASLPLKAVASYSDGDTDDVTDKVTWSSSDSATVFVGDEDLTGTSDGLRADKGKISALMTGTAVITASQDKIDGSVTVGVTDDLDSDSMTITPPTTLYADETYNFAASASFGSDTSDRRDISGNLSWTSSDTSSLSFADSSNTAKALAKSTNSITVTATCAPNDASIDDPAQATVSVDVKDARSVVDVAVKYDGNYIGEDDQISVNTSDSTIQLELYLLYSDETYSATDLASDDETTWDLKSSSGEESTINKDSGLVTIAGEGLNNYNVRHVIGTKVHEIDFSIRVE